MLLICSTLDGLGVAVTSKAGVAKLVNVCARFSECASYTADTAGHASCHKAAVALAEVSAEHPADWGSGSRPSHTRFPDSQQR